MEHERLIAARWDELHEKKEGLENCIRSLHRRLDSKRGDFNEAKDLLDIALQEMKEIKEEIVLLSKYD